MWFDLIQFGLPLFLILLGFLVGRVTERRHFRSLKQREAQSGPVLTNLKKLPGGARCVASSLCLGSVVIASDYFKFFGASLKGLVGGRLRTLETVLERGRRESLLRMRQQAAEFGADMVMNVRLETAIVMRSRKNRAYPAAEVIAYGTAVKLARDA
ncbi:MAG: YbjQ family protein [Planctomycetota bacterium]|jgi:uncharacterized protein YbjQ (UPF0145 family)